MSARKPPSDSDLPGGDEKTSPWDPERETDPFEEKTATVHPHVSDTFEDSKRHQVVLDPHRATPTGSRSAVTQAPEVSRGPWRERAFAPRHTMPKEEIISGMAEALKAVRRMRASLKTLRDALKSELLPLLRQAVEQVGGDGMDFHLSSIFTGIARQGKDSFLRELCAQMQRLNATARGDALLAEMQRLAELVERALSASDLHRLSLRWLEKEFEGRLDVDSVLSILFADDAELAARRVELDKTIETIRQQLKSMPGAHPDGLFQNFSRLKVERRLLDAELRRRVPRGSS